MILIIIIISISFLLFTLFLYSLCKAASFRDATLERLEEQRKKYYSQLEDSSDLTE